MTALHHAASACCEVNLSALLSRRYFDPNRVDSDGSTPLVIAIGMLLYQSRLAEDCVKILIRNKDVNVNFNNF